MYVDGVAKINETITPNLQTTAVMFGKVNSGTAYWYKGLIDEARIYNRALMEDEVLQLYNFGARRAKIKE